MYISNLALPDVPDFIPAIVNQIWCAVKTGDLEEFKRLSKNAKNKNPVIGANNATILHLAAQFGQLDIIKYIAPFVTNINPKDGDGWTPMASAAIHGHLDIVKWYAKVLEDPNPAMIRNDEFNGTTPMHMAAQKGHYDIFVFLSQLVNDTNPSDQNGFTPLHLAAQYNHLDIVMFAVPNLTDKNPEASEYYGRTTPLHEAAKYGHMEIVEFLVLLLGNETNPEDSKGMTPLHLAAANGHINVVKLYAEVLENPNPGRTRYDEFKVVVDRSDFLPKIPNRTEPIKFLPNRSDTEPNRSRFFFYYF